MKKIAWLGSALMLTMLVGCNNDKDETPIQEVKNGTNEVIDDVEKGSSELMDDVTPGKDIDTNTDIQEQEKGTINTGPNGEVNEGTINNEVPADKTEGLIEDKADHKDRDNKDNH